jgi:shikimate dehydrogenase
MKKYGLIGYPLSHSFSKSYFAEKFQNEGIEDCSYENYPLENISELTPLIQRETNLYGLNVTIPYKQEVKQYLNFIDKEAEAIGAVNTVRIERKSNDIKLEGYNTDVYGFEISLCKQLKSHHQKALILGTGGASLAVQYVLSKLNIEWSLVSRTGSDNILSYKDITSKLLADRYLIVNTTPLGMYPNIDNYPPIPYEALTNKHYLYDLVYNPLETSFLKKGKTQGAAIKNGLEMLHLQAEKAWNIWNNQNC